jgi:hypothetical protein
MPRCAGQRAGASFAGSSPEEAVATVERIKVPVAEVAITAYRAVFGRLGLMLELAWLPLLVLLAAALLPGLVAKYVMPTAVHAASPSALAPGDLAVDAIALLCLNAFAVRWHQLSLFADIRAVPRRVFLRAWARFMAYTLLISLLVYLLALGLFALAASADGPVAEDPAAAGLVVLATALALALGLAIARCSLIFPAAACGEPLGLVAAWRQMRGNTWRLIGATLMVVIPIVFTVGLVLSRIFAAAGLGSPEVLLTNPPLGSFLLAGVVDVVLRFILVALGATILSEFYRRILRRGAS